MKTSLLLLLTLISPLGFSQSADEAVHVTTVIIDKPAGIKSDQLICLGGGWEELNMKVAMRLERLSTDYPELFINIDDKQQNCFAPVDVPVAARKNLDALISQIDRNAKDSMYVSVDRFGPFVIKTNFPLKHQNDSLGKKILRAEALVGGVQVGAIGLLAILPSSVTHWDKNEWKNADKYLARAWTSAPVMDRDSWWMNGVIHPYGGALYYNALRSQGASRLESFIYSTIQSTFWEYGLEALAEQPSIQDLILTPLVGSLMGELAHMATMRMRENGFNLGEKIIVTIINPAYVVMNGYKVK